MAGTAAGAAKRRDRSLDTSPVQGATPSYVVGRRPLKMGLEVLQPGEVVPGAHDWPRIESWVRTGALVRR